MAPKKSTAQTLKGGNTQEFYHAEGVLIGGSRYSEGGTDNKSLMLTHVYPDCVRIVHKFGRVHHHVDYRRFASNKLKRRADVILDDGVNDYGMRLRKRVG